ncbi:MAG TPA: hypothetical protein VK814_09465 [Acidobacteriaceae bacterium]|nr:hypothetical protein [Acidobacteriaceae bacterium]
MHWCSASRCSCWPSGCGEHQIIEEHAGGQRQIIKKLRRYLN